MFRLKTFTIKINLLLNLKFVFNGVYEVELNGS